MNEIVDQDRILFTDYTMPVEPRSDLYDPSIREKLILALVQLGQQLPAMRFGQLVAAVASGACGHVPEAVYDAEDDELLAETLERIEFLRVSRSE